MRRTLLLIPLLAAMVGCQTVNKEQIAINRVLQERMIARQKTGFAGQSPQLQQPGPYVKLLQKITTEDCPQDFRLAWLEYVQTWERNASPANGLRKLAELGIGLTTGHLAIAADALRPSPGTDTDEAFRKVQKAALEYGITAVK
jgi:hypothetical protein